MHKLMKQGQHEPCIGCWLLKPAFFMAWWSVNY